MKVKTTTSGPLGEQIAHLIRDAYIEGVVKSDTFLPPERMLCEEYAVARTTIRRALSLLKKQGLLASERGRGYRILYDIKKSISLKRVAILHRLENTDNEKWDFTELILTGLHRASVKHSCEILFINTANHTDESLITSLQVAGVDGVALCYDNYRIHQLVIEREIPCVVLDTPSRSLPTDYILQDNYSGAVYAAKYLLARGHTKIAWVGPTLQTPHSCERYSGARSAFIGTDFDLEKSMTLQIKSNDERAVKKMLQNASKRPTAILALWHDYAVLVDKVATEMGLQMGHDIELISWVTEQQYESNMNDDFASKKMPPMLTWNTYDMADSALTRLYLYKINPDLPALHIHIPMQMRGTKMGKWKKGR